MDLLLPFPFCTIFFFAAPPWVASFWFPVWIWFASVLLCTDLGFFLLSFLLYFLIQLMEPFVVAAALWVELPWNRLAEVWPSSWNRRLHIPSTVLLVRRLEET